MTIASALKRGFDIVVSGVGIVVLTPVWIFCSAAVILSSRGPVLFRQERMGRGGRPFSILKFRTMVQDAPNRGSQITVGDDPRITRIGRLLRKTKMDELPQLFNVLKGDMSLVGPRPEVRKYVEMFADEYKDILRVRPGITDFASIAYRNEAAILNASADSEKEYIERVLPEKIRLARDYLLRQSLWLDTAILFHTAYRLLADIVPSKHLPRNAKKQ
jgi:lipopolysaccharide/colanic/teichoic acid biosynthesis glycosyltransferase